MMPGVTLPDIENWRDEHLSEHSAHWKDLAARRVRVIGQYSSDAENLPFTGAGKKGMTTAIDEHSKTAKSEAAELVLAAETAQRGAEQLNGQRRTILGTVQQAQRNGFDVKPTWQVIDVQSRTVEEQLVRQPAAQAIAALLEQQAAMFMATETQLGADLTAHAGKLAGVQMVDNHTFKQDPLISNPKEPGKPNPIVGPAPKMNPPKTDDKSLANQAFDGMTDVVGGTMTDIGGAAALIAGGAAEPETGGLSTVAVIGGVGALYEGTKKVEDGLDKLLHLGNGDGG